MRTLDPQLLLRHRDFIRGVVQGVLRDEHLAEDAVQETWLAAMRSPPSKPGALRGWLARVGRNTALTFIRRESRRRAREALAARPEAAPDTAATLSRAQAVVEAVQALPEPCRTAVVERFFEGISAEEAARRHGVTSATVRNRLRRAFELLREEFEARHGALWPALLAPLAAPAEPAAGGVITGGLLMAKSKFAILGLLAAGMAVGWVMPWGRRTYAETPRAQEATGAVASLTAERDHLRSHAEALEQKVADLEGRLAAAGAPAERAEGASAGAADAKGAPGDIDWARLEAAIARSRAALARIGNTDRASMRTLSPEDQAVAQELVLEWSTAAAKARTATPHPILDPRFLPRIVGAMVGGVADLSPAQREQLEREMATLLASVPDPKDMTPIEAYGWRQKVMAEADARIDALLGADQKEAWRKVAPSWEAIKEGNQRYLQIGLRSNGPEMGVRVLRELTYHYGLTDAQQEKVKGIADTYALDAREVLRRFGQLGDDPPELPPDARARLRTALLDLQLGAEKQLLPLLDEGQLSRLRRQLPVILSFEDSGNMMIATKDDRGF